MNNLIKTTITSALLLMAAPIYLILLWVSTRSEAPVTPHRSTFNMTLPTDK